MKSTLTLTAGELRSVIESTLRYNGHEAGTIVFVGEDGAEVDLAEVVIHTDPQPLVVREQPETTFTDRFPETTRLNQLRADFAHRVGSGDDVPAGG